MFIRKTRIERNVNGGIGKMIIFIPLRVEQGVWIVRHFQRNAKDAERLKAKCSGFSIQAMRYVLSGNAVRSKSGKTVEDVRIYLVVVL